MSQTALNRYKLMWIFCCFDLPTKEKSAQKQAGKFRKALLEDGFTMFQYSIYIRCCNSRDAIKTHIKRVEKLIPPKGKISFFFITDKQFSETINIWSKVKEKPLKTPKQLEFF